MDLFSEFSLSAVLFSKHLFGVFVKPYQTYRSIVTYGRWGELFYIGLISVVYFALASLVKTASFRPFLLSKQFLALSGGAFLGYGLVVGALWICAQIWNKQKYWKGAAIAWGYSLIPTIFWFFMTSLLYVIIPPPRTDSVLGISFSFLYLTLTSILFFWKAELYYLTLRFGLQLDLSRIIGITTIIIPLLFVYSIGMYRLGIFRIPFL